jgi:hypothetical protein
MRLHNAIVGKLYAKCNCVWETKINMPICHIGWQ